MIYLDNAATTYPKPDMVYDALKQAACECGGNPGRGVHKLSLTSANKVFETREKIADMFGATPERVVFTQNTTYALNMAIKCLWNNRDGHILISDIEHNSVRRSVAALCGRKDISASFDVYSSRGKREDVIASIRSKIRPDTKMLIACHRSNIAPITLPIKEIGGLCRDRGLMFVVDAAQSAGSVHINMNACSIDALCAPGHKGLFGIMGIGFVAFSDRVSEERLSTLIEGGSGMSSEEIGMPRILPERLEAGTLPVPAIAALGAGIDYVQMLGIDQIASHENMLVSRGQDMLMSIGRCVVYKPVFAEGSAFVFNVVGRAPSEISGYLDSWGICTRSGLHCAPLAHERVGTPKGGAVRVSFSPMNTSADLDALYRAIKTI